MGASEVLVVGSLNHDITVETERRPAGGETVLGRSVLTAQGGKGGNQAAAAARAGARVAMVACVGADAAGDALRAGLERAGVDTAWVRVLDAEPSGTALIVVDDVGENAIVVVPGANARLQAGDVERALAATSARVVLAQLEVPEEAVVQAARAGHRLVLNASPVRPLPRALLAAADPLIVNAGEAAALASADAGRWPAVDSAALAGEPEALGAATSAGGPDPKALGAAVLAAGARSVVITLGARGAAWVTPAETISCPAPQVDVVDTTGAGDVFAGTLAAELSRDAGPEAALAAAVQAAAVAVGWRGAQPTA